METVARLAEGNGLQLIVPGMQHPEIYSARGIHRHTIFRAELSFADNTLTYL